MRIFICWGIFFCSLLSISLPAGSAIVPSSNNIIIPPGDIQNKIASLRIKDIQKSIGRKLSLKERISFFILKQKLRHTPKESLDGGDIALIFGIAGLAFLIIALFWPYFVSVSIGAAIAAIVSGSRTKKKDPGNKKARLAKLLGWITLGLIGILFIIILIAFASIGSWSFG